jgi:hypothetical protein
LQTDRTSAYCALHHTAIQVDQEATQVDPADVVEKLDAMGTLRLAKLDAERERALAVIKNVDLEMANSEYKVRAQLAEITQQHAEYKTRKLEEKGRLISQFNEKHATYREYIIEISEKFSLDPNHMTYDTETGVIRDLRNQVKCPSPV